MTAEFAPYAEYDPGSDAVYVQLSDARVTSSSPLDDWRILDRSASGSVVGVEFLGVSGGVDLSGVPNEQLVERLIEDLQRGIRLSLRT